jgi:hypothetical protein
VDDYGDERGLWQEIMWVPWGEALLPVRHAPLLKKREWKELEGYANSGKDVQTVFWRASPFTPILNKCVAFLRGLQENEKRWV